MAKGSVSRSAGILVQVGALPALVGCGYSGATPELDALVQEAADKLADTFGTVVQIRFNSDQESGGAWLWDGLYVTADFNAFTSVGVCSGTVPIRPPQMPEQEWIMAPLSFIHAQPRRSYIRVRVRRSWLQDPSLAPSSVSHKDGPPGDFWEPKVEVEVGSVDEAIAWLLNNLTATHLPAKGA